MEEKKGKKEESPLCLKGLFPGVAHMTSIYCLELNHIIIPNCNGKWGPAVFPQRSNFVKQNLVYSTVIQH